MTALLALVTGLLPANTPGRPPVTRGKLFIALIATLALPLVLALAVLAFADTVQGQSDVLVSNLSEASHSDELEIGNRSGTAVTQSFHTGNYPGGYSLTGVSVLAVQNQLSASETVTFKIYDSENDGTPRNEIYELETPTLTANTTVFFAAPAGARLNPDTNYHVAFQSNSNANADLTLALTEANTQTGEANWTIEDAVRYSEDLGTTELAAKISIHGYPGSPAKGKPFIAGEPSVHLSLRAVTTGIDDPDGLEDVSYSYQWTRVDEDGMSNAENISGATDRTYILTPDDVGKKVRVTVSFTDDNSVPEDLTSEVFPKTGTVTSDTLVTNFSETTSLALLVAAASGSSVSQGFETGTHDEGYRFTGVSVFIEQNYLTGSETVTIKVYSANPDGTPKDEIYALATPALTVGRIVLFAAPDGAKLEPESTYFVVFQGSADSAGDLGVSVTPSDSQVGETGWTIQDAVLFNGSPAGDAYSVKMGIQGVANNAPEGAPVISGVPRVGLTLNADTGAITDPDGLEDVSYSYQWVRVDEDGTSSPTEIAGATGSSYILTPADEGKRIRLTLSFTDDNSIPQELTSAAFPETGTVVDNTLVSNLSETSLGEINIGTSSGTELAQGFRTGTVTGNYHLSGVSVVISENNLTGSETATLKIYDSNSDGTPRNELYTLTTPPLTAGSTAFFPAPAGARLEPATSYFVAFQGTGDSSDDLKLATTASAAQTGETGWTIEDAWRLDGAPDAAGRPVKLLIHGVANSPATGTPGITGRPSVRVPLTADTSVINDPDGLANVSYQYQWIRVDEDGSPNETPIPEATGRFYNLTPDDVGKRIKVVVSFADDNLIPEQRTSAAYPTVGTVIDDTLVSNLSGDRTGILNAGARTGTNVTQGFRTGTFAGGYRLTGISVIIVDNRFNNMETATLKIYDSRADGTARHEVYSLTTPHLTERSAVFFAAPAGARLEPETTYFVAFQGTGDLIDDLGFALTDSDAESGEPGWAIEDAWRFMGSPHTTSRTALMGIHGEEYHEPAGKPVISGDPRVGLTLSADASAIVDPGLVDNASYQWVRVDADGTSNEREITGATGSTYNLSPHEEGKRVRVRVSFTDSNSLRDERVSDAYPATGTVFDDSLVGNLDQGATGVLETGGSSGTAVSQGFRTGSHLAGYHLAGVSVAISENNLTGSETAAFKLYSSNPNGEPGTEISSLTMPDFFFSTRANATAFFASPAGVTLQPNRTYHIVFQDTGNTAGDLKLATTGSDAQAGDRGWTIENSHRSRGDLAGTGASFKIGIHGSSLQETLVSNLSEASSTTLRVGDADDITVAQGFTTGSHPGGYNFSGVSVLLTKNHFSGSETTTFKIYNSDGNGSPKDELYTLMTPTLTEGNTTFFAARAGATFNPDTTYHLVFQGTGDEGEDLEVAVTSSLNQTGETGWTIEDDVRIGNSARLPGHAAKISIHGVRVTGEAVISGAPRVGLTLTADTTTITDAYGAGNVSYGYQWTRVDQDGTSNATSIPGGLGKSYTLTPADEGKRIQVTVSFTDDNSVPQEHTSNAFPATGTIIDDTLVSNLSETSSSEFRVGDSSGTNLTQGFRTGTFTGGYRLAGVGFVIEQNNFSSSETATFKIFDSGPDGTAANELYELTTPDLTEGSAVFFAAPENARLEPETTYFVAFQGTGNTGDDLELAVTSSLNQTGETGWTIEDDVRIGNSARLSERAAKMSIHGSPGNAAVGEPAISGEPRVGLTLKADTDAITDPDGLTDVSYSYQWVRLDQDGGSNAMPILGATDATYTLAPEDEGKSVRVTVSFTDDNSVPEKRTSSVYPATGTIIDDTLVSNLSEATAAGLQIGQARRTHLTQGFRTGPHVGGYRLTGMSVNVRGHNFTGSETAILKIYTSYSNGTAAEELYTLRTPPLAEGNTVFFAAPAGARLEPETSYLAVFQATGNSRDDLLLTVTDSDAQAGETGWTIEDAWRFRGTLTGLGRSIQIGIHGSEDSPASGQPVIYGAPRVGAPLRADTSGITDPDGLGNIRYSYQWTRVDEDGTSNPLEITGATVGTYILSSADEGKRVRVTVSFTDDNLIPTVLTSDAFPATGTVIDDTVVNNLSEERFSSLLAGNAPGTTLTQAFGTGDNAGGYRLNGISVIVTENNFSGSERSTLRIYDSLSDGTLGNEIYTLMTPALTQGITAFFAAPPGAKLEPETTYFVAFQGTGNNENDLKLASTNSDAQSGDAGWTIGDAWMIRGTAANHGRAVMMGIHAVTNNPAMGEPVITGPPRVGLSLNADTSGITDPDGLQNVSYSYRWGHVDEDGISNSFLINKATGKSYTLTPDDEGKKIRVIVSFTADNSVPEQLTSALFPEVGTIIDDTLVGNLSAARTEEGLSIGSEAGANLTQGFRTGTRAGGYRLDGVSAVIKSNNFAGSQTAILKIYTSGADGTAESELYTLETPELTEGNTVFFAAPPGARLEPETTYFVAFQGTGERGDDLRLTLTASDAQTGETGWSIEDAWRFQGEPASAGLAVQIGIHGGQLPPVPVAAVADGASLTIEFNTDLNTTAPANSAFTVTKGSGDTEQTLTGTPSITGRVLTLTLQTGITAADTNIKVDYEKPEANPIQDTSGGQVASFTDLVVGNVLADTTAPSLHDTTVPVLAANGRDLTITFSETLRSFPPPNSAFTVKSTPAGGTETTLALDGINGVTVTGSTVVLKLALPIAHDDADVKVSYVKPDSGPAIEDPAGNEAANFTDETVTNNSVIPRVSVTASHEDFTPTLARVSLTFTRSNTPESDLSVAYAITETDSYVEFLSSEFDPGLVIIQAGQTSETVWLPDGYTGNTSGTFTVRVVAGNDNLPHLTENSATVEVKVPASGRFVTASHRETSHTVTEGGSVSHVVDFVVHAGTAEPRSDVTVALLTEEGTAKRSTETEDRDYTHISLNLTVPPGDWTARGEEWVASKTATLETVDDVDNEEYEGDEMFSAYFRSAQGQSSRVGWEPGAGRVTITIEDNDTLETSSVEVTSTATDSYYDANDTITFLATFNGNVTVDETNGTPSFAFDIGGETRQADYSSGSDSKLLVFSYTVAASDPDDHDGISWNSNSLNLNNGTIRFTSDDVDARVDASLGHTAQGPLADHKVNAAAPTLLFATVNATTMRLEFSEDLNTTPPALGQFTGKKTPDGGSETDLAFTGTPSISGSTVTLTLATASSVVATDTDVKVSYTKPDSNPLKDLGNKEVEGFTDKPVTNVLGDTAAPALHTTTDPVLDADGRTLTITFDEPIKHDGTPDASAFTVKATPAGGSEVTNLAEMATVRVSGSAVVLTLAKPLAHNDGSVKVSYTKPVSGDVLEDLAGNDLESFTDQDVTNNSAIPRVSIEAVHPDATPLIAPIEFQVTRSNTDAANALPVRISIDQGGFLNSDPTVPHLDTIEIPAGSTSAAMKFPARRQANSASVTATLADDTGYTQAPGNSASVTMKVPASGPAVTISHQQGDYSVAEGDPLTMTVTFTTAPGVAQPREDVTITINYVDGTAAAGIDFDETSAGSQTVLSGDWTENNGVFTATRTTTVETIEDSQFQGHLRFTVTLGIDDTEILPVCPPETRDGSLCVATVTIEEDEELAASGVEVTSSPSGGYYNAAETITFKVTFNENVTVDGTNGTPGFAFDIGGRARQAEYSEGSDSRELTFSYTVAAAGPGSTADVDDHDGISWETNPIRLNGGTINFMSTEVTARVPATLDLPAGGPLPGHRVDTETPTLLRAEVDGDMLHLVYSEELNTAAPSATAYTVTVDGGSGANPTNVAIDQDTVTLTLVSAVTPGQTVTVSYTKPNSNPIRDLGGHEAGDLTNRSVEAVSDIENLSAAPDDGEVTLSWDLLTDGDLTGYQYRHRSTADNRWNPNWTDVPGSSATTTSYTAENLTNGIEYTFQVRPVYTRNGQVEYGRQGGVKSAPRGALVGPMGLTATPDGTGRITLSWANPNDVTLTGYEYRYMNENDADWNPDWTPLPGSDATTTTHTLSNLQWDVLHTFELRAVRGGTVGPPSSQAQGTPPGDTTAPSVVRELRAVVQSNSRVLLYFRGPARSGDANLGGFEYRYADSNAVPETVSWQSASSTQVSNRTIILSGLEGDTLYTFEVRAVNENERGGPPARVQATTTATPVNTTPSAPRSLTAEGGEPYTELDSVDDPFSDRTLPARVARVDVFLQWEPAVDNGNAVIQYVYRYAEGESVPSTEPWRLATDYRRSDELEFTVLGLKTGTLFALEVAAQFSGGGVTGPPDSVQITTPAFTGPHYTLSAPSSVDEGETFTITVSRTNTNDGESSANVEIHGPGERGVNILRADFGTEDDTATVDYVIAEDDQTTDREIRIRVGHVGDSTENTYSVEWHIVTIDNITPQ